MTRPAEVRLNPTIFREYDIRGVVGADLTPEVAAQIARGYAALRLEPGAPVVLGMDNREHSPTLAEAIARGLSESGCQVMNIGTVITPTFYFARAHWNIEGGVMVTASHNPSAFNGLKLGGGPGTLYGEEIQAVRRRAEAGPFRDGPGTIESRQVGPAYAGMLREKIRLGPRRLRVALDCGNGTSSLIAPQVLASWGGGGRRRG